MKWRKAGALPQTVSPAPHGAGGLKYLVPNLRKTRLLRPAPHGHVRFINMEINSK